MFLLARTSLRVRWRAYVGVFLTVATAVALVAACGSLLESGIRANIPPEAARRRTHRRVRRPDGAGAARQRRRRRDCHRRGA